MSEPRWLVPRYYLFRATNSAGFYVPVAILYLQDEGYGLGFIGVAYAVFGLATLAAEIPSGYLGDWLGRRASLAVGSALRTVVLAAYPLVDGATAYLVIHVLWATGRAFRSGTQDAWLYEILKAHFDEEQFARVEGRGRAILLVTSAAGAVAGGYLYGVDPGYPFFANAALAALGLPILVTFPPVERDGGGEVFTVRDAVRMLRLQVARPEVRWLVAYAALFNALFLVTRVYEQPALDAVGVPVTGFGLLYAGFKLVSAGAAASVGWFEDRLGARGVFALLMPAYGLAYASLALFPVLVVPALFLNRGLRVLTIPVRNQYLNDRLEDVGRATVLSGVAMALALVGSVSRLVAGWGTEAVGVLPFLAQAGVAVVVVGVALWTLVSPIRAGNGTAGAESDAGVTSD